MLAPNFLRTRWLFCISSRDFGFKHYRVRVGALGFRKSPFQWNTVSPGRTADRETAEGTTCETVMPRKRSLQRRVRGAEWPPRRATRDSVWRELVQQKHATTVFQNGVGRGHSCQTASDHDGLVGRDAIAAKMDTKQASKSWAISNISWFVKNTTEVGSGREFVCVCCVLCIVDIVCCLLCVCCACGKTPEKDKNG